MWSSRRAVVRPKTVKPCRRWRSGCAAGPAGKDYAVKAEISTAITASQGARDALGNYYRAKQKIPGSLAGIGIASLLSDGTGLAIDSDKIVLTASTNKGELIFTPVTDARGDITWNGKGVEGLKSMQLPPSCQ